MSRQSIKRCFGRLVRMHSRGTFWTFALGKRLLGRPRICRMDYIILIWELLGVTLVELEEVAGLREVEESLLRLLPKWPLLDEERNLSLDSN